VEELQTTGGSSTNPPVQQSAGGGGLSPGAISGIVIGSVAFVGLLGIAANEVVKKRNRTAAFGASSSDLSDEFEGYNEVNYGTGAQRRRLTEHNVVIAGAADGGEMDKCRRAKRASKLIND